MGEGVAGQQVKLTTAVQRQTWEKATLASKSNYCCREKDMGEGNAGQQVKLTTAIERQSCWQSVQLTIASSRAWCWLPILSNSSIQQHPWSANTSAPASSAKSPPEPASLDSVTLTQSTIYLVFLSFSFSRQNQSIRSGIYHWCPEGHKYYILHLIHLPALSI